MLSFRHTKQTSKNVAGTTFNNIHQWNSFLITYLSFLISQNFTKRSYLFCFLEDQILFNYLKNRWFFCCFFQQNFSRVLLFYFLSFYYIVFNHHPHTYLVVYSTVIRPNLDAKDYDYLSCPASIYTFKFNNRNTRARCKICSQLKTKTLERR